MGELLVFLGALALSCVLDLRQLVKRQLKREMLPYLLLIALCCAGGILYFTDPLRKSLVSYILDLFKIGGE